MRKRRVKKSLWPVAIALLISAGTLAFASLGELLARTQSGADPAAALKIVPSVPAEVSATLTWLPDARDTGREMEPFTRSQIAAAYLRAWAQWNAALSRGDGAGLATHFAGPALLAVEESVGAMGHTRLRVSQSDLAHTLQLHLYAADGSIVVFSDSPLEIRQDIRDAGGDLVMSETMVGTYDVLMFLEDGNWRVRHLVRR